jgi:YfiH family protein
VSQSILTAQSLQRRGVVHGFTTRVGGVSAGPYESLNLSGKVGDDPGAVAQNRRLWGEWTGLDWANLVELEQVHGIEVLVVDRPPAGGPPARCDASATDRDDVVLAVRTADCVPILLFCPVRRAAAAVHSGWRGTLAGAVASAVATLQGSYACRPADLLAVIGPCIRTGSFEVGAEVFEPFHERFGDPVARRIGSGLHVDLAAANRIWLERAGLAPGQVEDLGLCTHAGADRFFSHRRDRGRSGRQMAFISLCGLAG